MRGAGRAGTIPDMFIYGMLKNIINRRVLEYKPYFESMSFSMLKSCCKVIQDNRSVKRSSAPV